MGKEQANPRKRPVKVAGGMLLPHGDLWGAMETLGTFGDLWRPIGPTGAIKWLQNLDLYPTRPAVGLWMFPFLCFNMTLKIYCAWYSECTRHHAHSRGKEGCVYGLMCGV